MISQTGWIKLGHQIMTKKAIISPLYVLYTSRLYSFEYARDVAAGDTHGPRFDVYQSGPNMSYWKYPLIFNYKMPGPQYWNVDYDFSLFGNRDWISCRIGGIDAD